MWYSPFFLYDPKNIVIIRSICIIVWLINYYLKTVIMTNNKLLGFHSSSNQSTVPGDYKPVFALLLPTQTSQFNYRRRKSSLGTNVRGYYTMPTGKNLLPIYGGSLNLALAHLISWYMIVIVSEKGKQLTLYPIFSLTRVSGRGVMNMKPI